METRRSLKEQELFYAEIEGKHSAMDDHYKHEMSGMSILFLYRYDKEVQSKFMKGYSNACSEIGRQNRTSNGSN